KLDVGADQLKLPGDQPAGEDCSTVDTDGGTRGAGDGVASRILQHNIAQTHARLAAVTVALDDRVFEIDVIACEIRVDRRFDRTLEEGERDGALRQPDHESSGEQNDETANGGNRQQREFA